MKQKFAAFLAVMMLFSVIAAMPATAAKTSVVDVIVDGKAIRYTGAKPYIENSAVMLPVRATASALGMTVSFKRSTHEVVLTSPDCTVIFHAGSGEAAVNGTRVSLNSPTSIHKGRVYAPNALFESLPGLKVQYDPAKQQILINHVEQGPEATAAAVVGLLTKGGYGELAARYFDLALAEALPAADLEAVWNQVIGAAGAYLSTESITTQPSDSGKVIVTAKLVFERMKANVILTMNDQQKLAGLFIQPAASDDMEIPEGITEEKVVVGQGGKYPLEGTLTLPEQGTGPYPAVVLVQGSGPSDRDESIGAYKPFRDIAWGLAQQGIAVLRYDKRTFAHAASFTKEEAARLTVKEETVDDAIAAASLLKSDGRIDSSRVFIVGHSLGGMLAPRIDAEGGNFAGLILLAGSPRPLWDIIYDQNAAFIAKMSDSDPKKAANLAWLEAEYKKAKQISDWSPEKAASETVFGIPASYFKEMDSHSADGYAKELTKPVLVLQGEDDFQVFANKDYLLWQEHLRHNPNTAFKLYPGLNHFFVDYSGPDEGTAKEYQHPGTVSEEVILDIAKWVQSGQLEK
ncbi:alpha/beta fold hydrolase [Paenibacillus tarimensis]|uniref:alpha/beta fold hydrolase n=1 Tax=Paenibacillus tarimensis TaxID=416012 RepID=UPI001F32B95A|nr:alpha/beta fold hydrolase [Paenibacillus tarimensis]MCF2944332.1 alpha/beta fold hydrolase [Paenibacillus tarimensis]